MRGACIDIGSNTTRLLVADCDGGRLSAVAQERVFTHIGRGRQPDGSIDPGKIEEVTRAVEGQLRRARDLDAAQIRAVATAAIRRAPNSSALAEAVADACGVEVEILSGEEEARLAFLGAASTLDSLPAGELGVVDVGGGSCELAVGTKPDRISWSASLPLGSGELTDVLLRSDPPSQSELRSAGQEVAAAFAMVTVPRPAAAVAVGGSAASLRVLAGPVLDAAGFQRALADLAAQPAQVLADKLGLDSQRVRLLPAGLLILRAASEGFGLPLNVSGGGIREGVLLEVCAG